MHLSLTAGGFLKNLPECMEVLSMFRRER